jgi:hypothetical protein
MNKPQYDTKIIIKNNVPYIELVQTNQPKVCSVWSTMRDYNKFYQSRN